MFTGIVQITARLTALDPQPSGLRLTLDAGGWTPTEGRAHALGDSICVSGVCLTVAAIDGPMLGFDVIPETLAKTTLGGLSVGDRVNLEPSVTPNQPLGGHFLQGHVDGVGQVDAIDRIEGGYHIKIAPPAPLMRYIIPKGSVAIDGVSLTIAAVHKDAFGVALIPTTLELTTLQDRAAGDRVNLEADILAKTVVASLERMQGGQGRVKKEAITMDRLRQAGFVE